MERTITEEEYEYTLFYFSPAVLKKDNYVCKHCGSKEELQAHHIKPRARGGKNILSNGICLCRDCHIQVHAELHRLEREDTERVWLRMKTYLKAQRKLGNKITIHDFIERAIREKLNEEEKPSK